MALVELQARFAQEENTLRESCWSYRLNRAVAETLEPLLAQRLGERFTTYAHGLAVHNHAKEHLAYETGARLGRAVLRRRLQAVQRDTVTLADILGSMPAPETLSAARSALLDITSDDLAKFFELYDLAVLDGQGIREIWASLWGFQDSGVGEDWIRWFHEFLPMLEEPPQWWF